MDLVRTACHSRKRIGDGKAAVIVPMPIDANLLARRFHDFFDGKFHQVERAIWRGVADGVAQNNRARAVSNGRRVQSLHGARIGANSVFRDVHGRKPVLDRELHRFFSGAFEVINRPVFHEAANWAGAKERCRFNRHAYALRDFHDGANVIFMRARGAVGLDLHPVRGDFARQSFGVGESARPGGRQTDVDRIDS